MIRKIGLALITALLPVWSFAKGFNDSFVAATGDLNSDGLQDIYIRQKPRVVPVGLDDIAIPIVLPPDVQPFVLQQLSGGTYTVVPTLTAQQRSAVAQWSPAGSLSLYSSDLNLDGWDDLIVKGVAASGVGTHDQFVFANTSSGATASSIRRVDAELTSFMQDTYRWVEAEHYFETASFYNNWFTQVDGRTLTGWWRVSYLALWGYSASDGTAFLDQPNDAYDPDEIPYGCGFLHSCDFDLDVGEWYIYGTATEHTAEFDDFNDHFNNDAVTFAKGQHASMQVLENIVAAKLQLPSIGGGERALVARETSVDNVPSDDEVFWDDLLLRVVLHDNYCAILGNCLPPPQVPIPVSRVDILVDRRGTGSYQSGTCGIAINYTHGVYQLLAYDPKDSLPGYNPDDIHAGSEPIVNLTGYTLERGGPDSRSPASNADKCTNKPKRIPQGKYTFSIGGTSANDWENVPTLNTAGIGRSAILIHAAAGAQGSIGCILVSKTSGSSGTFSGGRPSSDEALAEIQKALGYTNQFKYNYGYVSIRNFGN